MKDEWLLQVHDLKKYFPIKQGVFKKVVGYIKAVDGVSFAIKRGETLGLVGESGCGKSTLGKMIMKLIAPTAGQIKYNRNGTWLDLGTVAATELKEMRREIQMIFQDPFSSLNPRMNVRAIVAEPLRIHGLVNGKTEGERVAELLNMVGLREEYMARYPHEFSGGQRQRIGIARALALNPKLVICDEPVSALDVSVQAQVLNLLESLQQELGLTYLFIAHDLNVVAHISDRVMVMYLGRIAEIAPVDELYNNPKHPYTEALLNSIPVPDPKSRRKRFVLRGAVPNPANPPSGCYFHTRCPYAQKVCEREVPPLKAVDDLGEHHAACHFVNELALKGCEAADMN